MDDALRVRRAHGVGQGNRQAKELVDRHAAGMHETLQRSPFHEFHRQEVHAA